MISDIDSDVTGPGRPNSTAESVVSGSHSPPPKPATAPPTELEAATELDQILAHWENATSSVRRLNCEFARFKYDHTFEVEKRGEGKIALDREGRGRIELVGARLLQERPARLNRKGKPYALEADAAETWHWTGPRLFRIDGTKRTYEAADVPASGRIPFLFGELDVWQLFWAKPFLLGMPAAELKEKFTVTVFSDKPDDEVWLSLVARRKEIAVHYEKAIVILDRRTWLTKAVKIHDVVGADTVLVFKNVTVQTPDGLPADDLSDANLEAYRQVGLDSLPAKQPAK